VGTITAQLLISSSHPYMGGINPTHIMYLWKMTVRPGIDNRA